MQTEDDQFKILGEKLRRNVYGSLKGKIRLKLLQRDVAEFCPGFSDRPLTVLDVGGGEGQFALICAEHGHHVELIDRSKQMVNESRLRLSRDQAALVSIRQGDFLLETTSCQSYGLVNMHGSAEWMSDPEAAIRKAAGLVSPGGCLSLLVYNRDRHILKRGVSGQLLKGEKTTKSGKLTPPGARSAAEVEQVLHDIGGGKVLLKSGIRVFQGFFRTVPDDLLSFDGWMEQELRYYRQEPFASLGEHSHFIWQRKL